MGNLPNAVNQTYVAGVTEVASADMNDLQVGQVKRSHGSLKQWFPVSFHDGVDVVAGMKDNAGGTRFADIMIDLPAGTKITRVRTMVTDHTTAKVNCRLVTLDTLTGGGIATIGTSVFSDQSGNSQNLEANGLPYTVVEGFALYMGVVTGHTSHYVYGCDVEYEKPIV